MPASEQVAWFMAAAARAGGRHLLAAAEDAGPATAEALGLRLLRLFSGGGAPDLGPPTPVSVVMASPYSPEALTALEVHVGEVLDEDPPLAAAVDEMLDGFFRDQFESGDGQMLADLGSLLWWDDPPRARDAFERALEAGNQHALLDLAKLRHAVFRDWDAAQMIYQQAAESADPDVAVEALVELGQIRSVYREATAAQAAFQQAIDTRHPRWAPQAMIGFGNLLLGQLGDEVGAQAMFQQAIEFGDPDSRARALVRLATLLERRGDMPGAKAAWHRAIDSRAAPWAEVAFCDLVNQLQAETDLDGARAAHRLGVETATPDAAYALVVIGNLLREQGDVEEARAAWQQAIDTGYSGADDFRESLSPPAEDEDEPDDDDGPADLPPGLDPRNVQQTGIAVLDHGLPELPDVLTYQMAVPVAYWTEQHCAVVLFLHFSRDGRERWPLAVMATFTRDQGSWQADTHWMGTGWGNDPIANPGDLREMDGQAMTVSGGSRADTPEPGQMATVWHGRAAPAVRQIALLQDGHEDRRPLDSHFGAWVVCTENPSPFHVTALDQNGSILADIGY